MRIRELCYQLSLLLGGCAEIFYAMCLLSIFDYVSVAIYAYLSSRLTGKNNLKVILQKGITITGVIICVIVEDLFDCSGRMISTVIIIFFICYYLVSIITTLDMLKVPIPQIICMNLRHVMSPVEGGESKLFKCLTVNLMCEECKVESSKDRDSSVDIRKSNKMEDVDENKEIDV